MLSFADAATFLTGFLTAAKMDLHHSTQIFPIPLLDVGTVSLGEAMVAVTALGVPAAFPSLPRQDWFKDNRAKNIENMKSLIKNEDSVMYIQNVPGVNFSMPRQPEAGAYMQAFLNIETGIIGTRTVLATTIPQARILGDFNSKNPVKMDTFEQMDAYFDSISSIMPVPRGLKNWRTDEAFGADRFTWGGYSLQAELNNTLAIGDYLATSITGSTIAQLIESNRLFKVDFTAVGAYSKSRVGSANPYNQTIPSTFGQFYLTANNTLMPLAVQVLEANEMVYTPKDTAQDWLFAKLALSTSQSVYYAVEHFSINHMQLGAIRGEAYRNLAHHHPVASLLLHHFNELFGNTVLGQMVLLQNGTELDNVFASGGKGASIRIGDRMSTYNFQDQKLVNAFNNAGTMHVPGFKYRDDILAIRNATYNLVFSYLSKWYIDDADVRADVEVQSFANACADKAQGAVRGFPSSFQTQHELVDTVTDLIMFVSAQHNVLNGGSTWDSQSFPMSPKAFYGSYPTSKGEVSNARDFLARDPSLIGQDLYLVSQFHITPTTNSVLGNSYGYGSPLGVTATKEVEAYKVALQGISQTIHAREAGNPRPFLNLLPEEIPYQCWV